MEMYKTEGVVEMLTAKIYSTDKNIPDCRVIIRLTAGHLFISEDNFDGTFEDHYVIEFDQIDDIRIDAPYKTSIDYSAQSLDKTEKQSKHWTDGLMGGMLAFGRKGKNPLRREQDATKVKFLEVIYKENYEKTEHLYFDECNKSPEKLIKEFKKLKESR